MMEPQQWPMGEIDLGGGRVMLVPQPITVGPLEDFYLTVTDLQPVCAKAPSSNVERREDSLWGFALDLIGPLLSIGIGSMCIVYGLLS